MNILKEHLSKAFSLTRDLAQGLSSEDLKLKLKDIPSNTIGEQFWCIIGARESYLKAIINQGWVGFSCSLDDTESKDKVLKSLDKSTQKSFDFLDACELNQKQTELLIALLEHEVQHHGQLIRYIYGNKLTFPKSWNQRYNV